MFQYVLLPYRRFCRRVLESAAQFYIDRWIGKYVHRVNTGVRQKRGRVMSTISTLYDVFLYRWLSRRVLEGAPQFCWAEADAPGTERGDDTGSDSTRVGRSHL